MKHVKWRVKLKVIKATCTEFVTAMIPFIPCAGEGLRLCCRYLPPGWSYIVCFLIVTMCNKLLTRFCLIFYIPDSLIRLYKCIFKFDWDECTREYDDM